MSDDLRFLISNVDEHQFAWTKKKLREMVDIDSETGREKEILAYLEREVSAYGLPVERQRVAKGRYNLLLNPMPKPELIIDAHVDTVPKTMQGRTCPSYDEGPLVYGRGACDDKGSVAAVLTALRSFFEKPPASFPVTVAFTVDEEAGAAGSEILSRSLRSRAALVMEPTGLALCPAEGGYQRVRLVSKGRDVHGASYQEGDNACSTLIKALNKLSSLSVNRQHHPLLGNAGYNLCYLRGGEPGLVVPLSCEAVVDFILHPGMNVDRIRKEIIAFCEKEGLKADFVEIALPYEIREDEEIVSDFRKSFQKALGCELKLAGMKSWTNAQNYNAASIPAVVWGPGRLDVCHTAREYIDVREIVAAGRVLEQFWRDISLNP